MVSLSGGLVDGFGGRLVAGGLSAAWGRNHDRPAANARTTAAIASVVKRDAKLFGGYRDCSLNLAVPHHLNEVNAEQRVKHHPAGPHSCGLRGLGLSGCFSGMSPPVSVS